METSREQDVFAKRAVDHLLDFGRERDVVVAKIEPLSALDRLPTFAVSIPTQSEGDWTACRALESMMMDSAFVQAMLPLDGYLFPCAVMSARLEDGRLHLEMRLVGSPIRS